MGPTDWHALYLSALRTAKHRAAKLAASSSPELIACGFTTNVDRVVQLTGDLLARLVAETAIDPDGPRRMSVETPNDLVTAIVQSVAAGEGIDLPVSEAATQDWLLARVDGRHQLGGTGAQAANTLALLGFPTLLHHTGLSPVQASVFAPNHILVPGDGGPRPVAESVAPGDPTMWHVALEYHAGLRVNVDGREIVAPHPNRVIVSYDPVNAAFTLDRRYVDAVATIPNPIRCILISGFSQVVVPEALSPLLDETRDAIHLWRAARPELFIHLELGAMPRVETLASVVDALGGAVDSLGFNVDELRDLMSAWDEPLPTSPSQWPQALDAIRRRVPTPRLGLHSLGSCLTLTNFDACRERDALLVASLVASTRARIGTYPTRADLTASLAITGPDPCGIALLEEIGLDEGIVECGDGWLVAVPTITVPDPIATVGLGDSFTGALLAML